MLEGSIVAVEVDAARAEQLAENALRLGASNVEVVNADGRDLPAGLTGFDHALVDAPCSGLGVLASRPDLRWRAEPLPGLQRELLRATIDRTRPGGTVVYSTCTVNADECEAVVDAVVGDGPVEVDERLGDEWPMFRHPARPQFLQTLPHVHGTSGFFVARLRRR
jgi:16S rRNA (cytosine967-C5)-methyltransferase